MLGQDQVWPEACPSLALLSPLTAFSPRKLGLLSLLQMGKLQSVQRGLDAVPRSQSKKSREARTGLEPKCLSPQTPCS